MSKKRMYFSKYSSPLGLITLAADDNNLIGAWNEGQRYHGDIIFENMIEKSDLAIIINAKNWLDSYFACEQPSIAELSISPIGSDFRQEVWKILCEIPYGETTTYGEIAKIMAKKLGRKTMSSQAVGGAIGHNPISIIIPCHRVMGAGGNLTGYAGGLEMKKHLLSLEGVDISKFYTPKKGTAI